MSKPVVASTDRHAAIVTSYDELLRRAVVIVSGWPRVYDKPDDDRGYPMRLSVSKGNATLEWVEDSQWDSGTLTYDKSFPAEMLEWSDDQLAAWQAEEERLLKLKDDEEAAKSSRKREAKEREQYEALKKKYGG